MYECMKHIYEYSSLSRSRASTMNSTHGNNSIVVSLGEVQGVKYDDKGHVVTIADGKQALSTIKTAGIPSALLALSMYNYVPTVSTTHSTSPVITSPMQVLSGSSSIDSPSSHPQPRFARSNSMNSIQSHNSLHSGYSGISDRFVLW